MLLHPRPRRVLAAGAAGGDWTSEVLKHPVERLTVVEIDDEVLGISKDHMGLDPADRRLEIVADDPRHLLRETAATYDLVALSLPTPSTLAANRFYTRECLEEARRALRPGGRLVVNAVTVETEALLLQRQATLGGELNRLAIARLEPIGGRHGWRPALPVTQWIWIKP